MSKPIRTAVFPVAGLGTRILPATKILAKELLPLAGKPLIQHAVEECQAAGIEEFVFVIARGKESLIDHFRPSPKLESLLQVRGKTADPACVRAATLKPEQIHVVYQEEALGLGHAVWCARDHIKGAPFAVLLPDDVFLGTPCLPEMVRAYERVGGNMAAAMEVARTEVSRYGILDIEMRSGALARARALIEKPAIDTAPSTLAIIGRYILDPAVLNALAEHKTGAGGEIQLTDAMARLIGQIPFHGFQFSGTRYDCGTKLGLIEANLAFGLADPETGGALRGIVHSLTKGTP